MEWQLPETVTVGVVLALFIGAITTIFTAIFRYMTKTSSTRVDPSLIEVTKKQIELMDSQNTRFGGSIDSLNSSVGGSIDSLNETMKMLGKLIETQISVVREMNQRQTDEHATLSDTMNVAGGIIQTMVGQMTEQSGQLGQVVNELDSLKKAVLTLIERIEQLNKLHSEVQSEVKDITSRQQTLETQVKKIVQTETKVAEKEQSKPETVETPNSSNNSSQGEQKS